MTPARKRALQWFHDRGEVKVSDCPSDGMMNRMICEGQLVFDGVSYTLTDKGRRALHGDRT